MSGGAVPSGLIPQAAFCHVLSHSDPPVSSACPLPSHRAPEHAVPPATFPLPSAWAHGGCVLRSGVYLRSAILVSLTRVNTPHMGVNAPSLLERSEPLTSVGSTSIESTNCGSKIVQKLCLYRCGQASSCHCVLHSTLEQMLNIICTVLGIARNLEVTKYKGECGEVPGRYRAILQQALERPTGSEGWLHYSCAWKFVIGTYLALQTVATEDQRLPVLAHH